MPIAKRVPALCLLALLPLIGAANTARAQLEVDEPRPAMLDLKEAEIPSETFDVGEAWTPAQLDSIIEYNMTQHNIPGVVAMVLKDGQVVWSNNYGFANLEESIPTSDTTVFKLASISKTFVANAAMTLWEDALLDLDLDINGYLPFVVTNPFYPDSIMTMRMLLSHTSSLARNDGTWFADTVQGDHPTPLGQYLADYLVVGGPNYSTANYLNEAPGTFRKYSNYGFALAAYIVEQIAGTAYGETFEQYCQRVLFTPLGMTETSWFIAGLDTQNVAIPYDHNGTDYVPLGHYGAPLYPAGQLRTSAQQLARHMVAFMDYGIIDGNRILDSSTVVLMRAAQFPGIDIGNSMHQGIGWRNEYGGDYTTWGHGGSGHGVNTHAWFDPDERAGLILLMNRRNDNANADIRSALRYFAKDADADGIVAGLDNCPVQYNPAQDDTDGDGTGDSCQCLNATASLTGEAANDNLGWRVNGAGDVNNDGFDDVIAGANNHDPDGLNNAGEVYVLSGIALDTIWVFPGEAADDKLGRHGATAGDITGDGNSEVAFGAYKNDEAGADAGKLYVASVADDSILYTINGSVAGDNFGVTVDMLGDVNTDGIPDLIVGATQVDNGGAGYVSIRSGADGTELNVVNGEVAGDKFGYAIAACGDVDNDNMPDFIVGAYDNDDAGTDLGKAYVFSGSGTLIRSHSGQTVGDGSMPRANSTWLGGDVDGGGDIDGDGIDDYIVGAPAFDSVYYQSGRAYVYSGIDGSIIRTHDGRWSGMFGWSVTMMGDLNGDGRADYAIGEPRAYRAHVYSGLDGTPLDLLAGEQRADWYARDVSGSADLNGDGNRDLIVGAFAASSSAGQLLTYSFGDADGDGIQAGCDNCPNHNNPGQSDTDGDGIGDACDCDCLNQGDVAPLATPGDGVVDVLDVVALIDEVFRSGPTTTQDASCPTPRGDLAPALGGTQCGDGVKDVLDVVSAIDHVFRSGPAPCDPCNP